MIALRTWIASTFAWFFCLYNIERIHGPINLSPWLYLFATAIILPVAGFRWLSHRRLALVYATATIAAYLAVKGWMEGGLLGRGLPLTITEMVALAFTLFLGWRIAVSLAQFERGASHLLMAGLEGHTQPLEQGQGEIYRELRRARRLNRPLAIVSLQPHKQGRNAAINPLVKEAQLRAASQYLDACVADVLAKELDDCGTILQEKDHFILVLPETTHADAEKTVARLKDKILARLGMEVSSGVATFPDEEITFVGLLEKAQEDMAFNSKVTTPPARPVVHSITA